MSDKPISPLRQRMIDDMTARRFKEKVQKDYVRHVRTFAAFLGRSPDTATSEDLRRYQLHMAQQQVSPWTINSAIAALRFFFTVTLERPDLVRPLRLVTEPRRTPVVLSSDEVAPIRPRLRPTGLFAFKRRLAAPASKSIPVHHRSTEKLVGAVIMAKYLILLVGVRGFEPPAPSSRTRCATRLRYTPTSFESPVYTRHAAACKRSEHDWLMPPQQRSAGRMEVLRAAFFSRDAIFSLAA